MGDNDEGWEPFDTVMVERGQLRALLEVTGTHPNLVAMRERDPQAPRWYFRHHIERHQDGVWVRVESGGSTYPFDNTITAYRNAFYDLERSLYMVGKRLLTQEGDQE